MNKKKRYIFFSKNLKVIKNILKKKTVRYFTLGNYWQQKAAPLEIPEICVTLLENFSFFLITPGYSACTYYFSNTPGNSVLSNPSFFLFFLIPHGTMIKLLFYQGSVKKFIRYLSDYIQWRIQRVFRRAIIYTKW